MRERERERGREKEREGRESERAREKRERGGSTVKALLSLDAFCLCQESANCIPGSDSFPAWSVLFPLNGARPEKEKETITKHRFTDLPAKREHTDTAATVLYEGDNFANFKLDNSH